MRTTGNPNASATVAHHRVLDVVPGGAADAAAIAEARRHLSLAALALGRSQEGTDGLAWVHHDQAQRDVSLAQQSLRELESLFDASPDRAR